MNIQTDYIVTAKLKPEQRIPGQMQWKMTHRGKPVIVNNPEVRYYAYDYLDAKRSVNFNELDFFKLEIDLITKTYTHHDDMSIGEENRID